MKIFKRGFDGGKKSGVIGFWLIEIKSLFSIVLLRFDKGSREAYHNHAFNAFSWFLSGEVEEQRFDVKTKQVSKKTFTPSFKPKYTPRDNLHRVQSKGVTWCLSIRGPWSNVWQEYLPSSQELVTLKSGRDVIKKEII